MQADMMATQEKLATETVEASVGGGVVKAVVKRRRTRWSRSPSTPTPSTPTTSRCCRT